MLGFVQSSRIFPALAVALALAAGACTTVLGVRDIFLDESLGPPGGEGGTEGGNPDGGGTDGGADVVVTCQADLKTDLANCGACRHACTNGVCQEGLCILAQDLPSPRGVVAGAQVYVALVGGVGSIVSCPTSGCASATVGAKTLTLDAGDPYPYGIAANDMYVFAADYSSFNKGGVRRVLTSGGDFRKLPAAPDLERSYDVAIDKTSVYWTTTGSPGAIHWCNLPDCANGLQTATAAASEPELIAVAADGSIVWSDNSGSTLKRCAGKQACTPQLLVPDFKGSVNGLVIDGTTVYWGTTLGEVLSCAVAGCANPTKLVLEAPVSTIGAVAVAGTSLYWSSMPFAPTGNTVLEAEGQVKACTMPKCSGADVRIIATKQHDPGSMAVDATSLYWTNSGKRGFTDGIGNLVKAPR